jgi:hypothetical protein
MNDNSAGLGCFWIFAIVAAFIMWAVNDSQTTQLEKNKQLQVIKRHLEKSVKFDDLNITKVKDNNYIVLGRVLNSGRYKLYDGHLRIQFQDCKQIISDCVIVFEQNIQLPEVPSKQARDFSNQFSLDSDVRIKYHLKITHQLEINTSEYDYDL